jgi:hypothetical protein
VHFGEAHRGECIRSKPSDEMGKIANNCHCSISFDARFSVGEQPSFEFFRSPQDSKGSCGCAMVGMGMCFGDDSGFKEDQIQCISYK